MRHILQNRNFFARGAAARILAACGTARKSSRNKKRGESAVDGAWGKIEAAAQEIMKGKPDMRYADAIDAACIAHPELVQEYEKSRR